MSQKAIEKMNRELEKKIRFEGEMARWARLAENFSHRIEEQKDIANSQLKIVDEKKVDEQKELSAADLLEAALKKETLRRLEKGLYVNQALVAEQKKYA